MESIRWKSRDGMEIEGVLITPINYDSKKQYSMLVVAHGGPAGAQTLRYVGGCDEYGEVIFPICWENLLSQGFIIFQPNFRGSSGYGRNFRLTTLGDIGGGDYQDIISGVDDLIRRGIADPNHLAIFGWSYGGYMTAWAITQTQRFKAAIEGAGLTNLISESGTTANLGYLTRYLGSSFLDNAELYIKRSPIFYARNITTPLLILHGSNDSNISITQSYELYNALNRQNKHVKMFVLPAQEHGPTNANIIFESIKEVNNWLKLAR